MRRRSARPSRRDVRPVSVYVFVGPSLSQEEARAELDAVYLPPVVQGDVYRVAREAPRAIGIVDGYFEQVPAVWHKEILWAMTQGIRVFGSASMGALRAAELAPFGMEGVGAIFEAYRDGVLRDDDEVAVRHGPTEIGYAVQSEAMVNIRATLAAAEAAGVIRTATRGTVERIAKELFYPDRAYPPILRRAAEQGVPAPEIELLGTWLPTGRVNQKRADALAMLRQMRARLVEGRTPERLAFRLEHTLQWDRAMRFAGVTRIGAGGGANTVRLEALLDELGLQGERYLHAYQATLLSYLALHEARRRGYVAGADDVAQMCARFRQVAGLQEPADFDRWLKETHQTRERFDTLMIEETLRARVREHVNVEVLTQLPDHLRLVGAYRGLLVHAEHKQWTLEAAGLQDAGLEDVGLTLEALLAWHFARLGSSVPDDVDGYARAHGFGDAGTFLRALAREYCYVRSRTAPSPSSPLAKLARALLTSPPGRAPAEGPDRADGQDNRLV